MCTSAALIQNFDRSTVSSAGDTVVCHGNESTLNAGGDRDGYILYCYGEKSSHNRPCSMTRAAAGGCFLVRLSIYIRIYRVVARVHRAYNRIFVYTRVRLSKTVLYTRVTPEKSNISVKKKKNNIESHDLSASVRSSLLLLNVGFVTNRYKLNLYAAARSCRDV